jgi:hypothetical protein
MVSQVKCKEGQDEIFDNCVKVEKQDDEEASDKAQTADQE